MFEVLAFVYDHHSNADARLQPTQLERQLRSVGFDAEDIGEALHWLQGLEIAAQPARPPVQARRASIRIYTRQEHAQLGRQAVGYLHFLEQLGVLTPDLREVVIERALAAAGGPMVLDQFKLIVLLVLRSFGLEPDALVFDELSADPATRTVH